MADSKALAEYKARLKYTSTQDKLLAEAWMKLALGEQATQKSLGDLRAKRATDFTKNAAGYLKSRDAGYTAQTARGAVELAKLAATMPVEFARAATLPDRTLQTTVMQGLSGFPSDTPSKDKDKASKAWEIFLNTVQPSSANVLGSYEWMVEKFGDPRYLGVNNGDARDALADVEQKVAVERKNGAAANAALEKIGPDSWSTFQRKHPELDPEADSTYEMFVKDAGIDLSIMPKPDAGFVRNIEAVAKNPEAHPEFFSDIDARDKASNEEQKRYEDLLQGVGGSVLDIEGAPGEAQDDSMRAYLAAWVRRPDVQWWAEQNGFELGKAEPIDPESDFGKEVAAGRVPGQMIVNGMLYRMRPDDLRAFRLAHAQVTQDPEDSIFRALGLAHKTGPRRMVEVEEIVEPGKPVKLVKRGILDDGVVALDSEGNFHWSTDDGKTWSPIAKEGGQTMMTNAEAAGDAAPVSFELPGATSKPVTRTRQLEYREPIYKRDAPNSVRGVDPETGKEVYLAPEQVAKVAFPGGAPSKGASLVDRINQVSAKRTVKKSGFDQETETQSGELPGAAPTAAQKRERKAETKAMQAVTPDLAALPDDDAKAPTEGSDEQAAKAPPFDRYAPRKSYVDTIREKAKALLPGTPQPHTIGGGTPPKPPGAVIGVHANETTGTTTPSTTTPTASTATDAQKKALAESRKRQLEAEVARQARAGGAAGGAL